MIAEERYQLAFPFISMATARLPYRPAISAHGHFGACENEVMTMLTG